jgi:hypothetical protein
MGAVQNLRSNPFISLFSSASGALQPSGLSYKQGTDEKFKPAFAGVDPLSVRNGRACPGHHVLAAIRKVKTWMPGAARRKAAAVRFIPPIVVLWRTRPLR